MSASYDPPVDAGDWSEFDANIEKFVAQLDELTAQAEEALEEAQRRNEEWEERRKTFEALPQGDDPNMDALMQMGVLQAQLNSQLQTSIAYHRTQQAYLQKAVLGLANRVREMERRLPAS